LRVPPRAVNSFVRVVVTQFDLEVGSSRCDDRAASAAQMEATQAIPPAARGRGRRSAASLPPQIELLSVRQSATNKRNIPKGTTSDRSPAPRLRQEKTTMTLKWMADRLKMGTWTHVTNRFYHLKK
jgi:hypothetical protein